MPNPQRTNPTNRLVLVLALLVTGAGACSSAGSTRSDVDSDASPPGTADSAGVTHAVPEHFSMIFGEGGGFAGRWAGFAIQTDGTVFTWSGPTANENNSTPAGMLVDRQMLDLWARIEAVDFFDLDVQDVGNMTAFMQITSGDRTHRISWIPGAEGFEPPRSSLDALYRHSLQVAGLASE